MTMRLGTVGSMPKRHRSHPEERVLFSEVLSDSCSVDHPCSAVYSPLWPYYALLHPSHIIFILSAYD